MKPFVWKLTELADMIKKRQENKYDVVIVIDGARGNGKSTLAYKLLTRTGNFNPRKDLMFTRDDVVDAIVNRKFSCIDADEMINSAHNREFFSGDQKNLIRIMNQYRSNHNILIGSIPHFWDLDPQIRKLVKLRITVVKRGIAVLQMARTNLYANDMWDVTTNKKIEESWSGKSRQGKLLSPKYHQLTTYAGHLFYGALSPEQQAIYDEIRDKKRAELKLDQFEEKEKPYWVEANEKIVSGQINKFKELNFYLMGKGVHIPSAKAKIGQYRREINLPSLMETWKEAKEEKKEEKAQSIF